MWYIIALSLGDISIEMGLRKRTSINGDDVAVTIQSVIGPSLSREMIDVCTHRKAIIALVHARNQNTQKYYAMFRDLLTASDLSNALGVNLTDVRTSICEDTCACKRSGHLYDDAFMMNMPAGHMEAEKDALPHPRVQTDSVARHRLAHLAGKRSTPRL